MQYWVAKNLIKMRCRNIFFYIYLTNLAQIWGKFSSTTHFLVIAQYKKKNLILCFLSKYKNCITKSYSYIGFYTIENAWWTTDMLWWTDLLKSTLSNTNQGLIKEKISCFLHLVYSFIFQFCSVLEYRWH